MIAANYYNIKQIYLNGEASGVKFNNLGLTLHEAYNLYRELERELKAAGYPPE